MAVRSARFRSGCFHGATSRLAERLGDDVVALAAVTGHNTLQMPKRYTHLRAEDLARRLA